MSYNNRYDLARYPIYYMAHIVGQNAENMSFVLSRYDLNNSAWRVIASLQHTDGLTIKELARQTVLERSFVSRVVARLEEMGYVRRDNPEDDRRTTRAFLTQSGRDIFTTVLLPVVQEQMRRALTDIPAQEIRQFMLTLAKMMNNVYRSANLEPPRVGPAGELPF